MGVNETGGVPDSTHLPSYRGPSPDDGPDAGRDVDKDAGKDADAGLHPVFMKSSQLSYALAFGVFLPIVTLGIEIVSGMSAGIYIDPIPTGVHLLMVALVPIANLSVIVVASKGWTRWRWPLGVLNSAALVVAIGYALVFLPIAPFAFLGILLVGLGFLPLSPILSVVAVWYGHRWLRDLRSSDEPPRVHGTVVGAIAGVMLIMAAEGPAMVTQVGLNMANSTSPTTQQQGIDLLRNFGSERRLLHACYGLHTDLVATAFGSDRRLDHESAREIYYRVTGRPFNSEPVPTRARQRGGLGWDINPADNFWWDEGLGGDKVAGRIPGLSLAASRMDGLIEPDPAIGYVEWTMVFANRSAEAREARCIIQLPTDGVVSRVTLWINGEEHEAAWGGGGQVRRAYEDVVVVQRRDPVLVTYAGQGRAMVQCFPVPPNDRMKIRVGVTFPMALKDGDRGEGQFRLPGFVERNFGVTEEVNHAVWLNGPRAMRVGDRFVSKPIADKEHEFRVELPDTSISDTATVVTAMRSENQVIAWTEDRTPVVSQETDSDESEPGNSNASSLAEDPAYAIVQTFETTKLTPPDRVVMVIDGSASLAKHADAIAQSLASIPAKVDLRILVADDTPRWLDDIAGVATMDRASAAEAIRDFDFTGGRDNVLALETAWDAAAEVPADQRGVVLWLHGPQPVVLRDVEALRQRMQRRPNGPAIYALPLVNGPNHITGALSTRSKFHAVTQQGGVADQVKRLADSWEGETATTRPARVRMPLAAFMKQADDNLPIERVHASQHLRRLWALDRITALIREGGPAARQEAADLGKTNQLVTPITGAVVLESQIQYKQHGLKQGDSKNSPAIPEPTTALMFLMMGGGTLIATGRRRRVR